MECPHCKKQYERETLLKHLMVCPDCGYHMRMDVPDRIAYLTDKDTFEELDTTLRTMNPIQMAGYEEKISAAEAKTSMNEAVVTGKCKIEGRDALLGIMSFDFLGGSMGSVVGEKISRLMLKGAAERIPVRVCRKGFFRSCRWQKPQARRRSWTTRAFLSFLCSATPRLAA